MEGPARYRVRLGTCAYALAPARRRAGARRGVRGRPRRIVWEVPSRMSSPEFRTDFTSFTRYSGKLRIRLRLLSRLDALTAHPGLAVRQK